MSIPEPARGIWDGGVFRFPIRIYYEDTDLGGMVYHARYVSFFERVRTEAVRGGALDVDELMATPAVDGGPLVYVVRSINLTYHRQAHQGDVLIGHVAVMRTRAAAVEARQWLTRGDDLITEADVVAALIGPDGRPRRWPPAARARWLAFEEEYKAASAAKTTGNRKNL